MSDNKLKLIFKESKTKVKGEWKNKDLVWSKIEKELVLSENNKNFFLLGLKIASPIMVLLLVVFLAQPIFKNNFNDVELEVFDDYESMVFVDDLDYYESDDYVEEEFNDEVDSEGYAQVEFDNLEFVFDTYENLL